MLNTHPFNPKKTPSGLERKIMATKKTAKKAATKKAPAKKTAKKAPAKKAAAKKTATKKTMPTATNTLLSGKIKKNKHFTIAQLRELMNRLLILRERISGEILSISRDSLSPTERDPSLSDQGTDTFDREFALNQLSSEQDVLFEIDEALRRLENGTYGICEMTEKPINIERLQALPYVRYSIEAQAELEKGQTTFRPFGPTVRVR